MALQSSQENYQRINESIAEELFKKKLNLRLFQTPNLAAFDTCLGLQQYLAHKPQVGVSKNGSNLIDHLSTHWLRTHTPIQTKKDNQSWYEFIESLSPETNFVIWSSENELTGEIMMSDKQITEIHQQLAKKRVFSIQIVHEENFIFENLTPYSILITRSNLFTANSSFVLCGDKVKAPSLMGFYQDLKSLKTSFSGLGKKNENFLQSVENQFSNKNIFYFNQFATLPHRLTDRVVFYFPDIAGSALQQSLKLDSQLCLTVSDVPFWNIDLWKNWWKEAESEKLIRGLLIISINAFEQDPALVNKIEKAITEIRNQSTWSIV